MPTFHPAYLLRRTLREPPEGLGRPQGGPGQDGRVAVSGEGAEVLYASVAVPIPARREFTYRVGAGLRHAIALGVRVRVPLGGAG